MENEEQVTDMTAGDPANSIQNVAAALLGKSVVQVPDPPPVVPNTPAPADPPPADEEPNSTGLSVPTELLSPELTVPTVPTVPVVTTPDADIEEINKLDLNTVDPKLRPNLAKMRDKLNGVTKEYTDLQAKYADVEAKLKAAPKTPDEAQKLFAEREAELLDQIAKMDLTKDPRFVSKYNTMAQPVLDTLKSTLASYNIEGLNVEEAVAKCIDMSPQMRIAFLQEYIPETISQLALGSMFPMFSQLDMIASSRNAELANHQKTIADLEAQSSQVQMESMAHTAEAVKRTALTATEQSEFLLKRVAGKDDWNKTVDALNLGIDAKFASKDPNVHAKALVESELMPVYKSLFLQEFKLRNKLEAAIKERNIRLPGINGNAPTSSDNAMKPGEVNAATAAASIAGRIFG